MGRVAHTEEELLISSGADPARVLAVVTSTPINLVSVESHAQSDNVVNSPGDPRFARVSTGEAMVLGCSYAGGGLRIRGGGALLAGRTLLRRAKHRQVCDPHPLSDSALLARTPPCHSLVSVSCYVWIGDLFLDLSDCFFLVCG